MKLHDAQHLAVDLMAAHNLKGWRFEFDDYKTRFGCCVYGLKTIFLSRPLTVANSSANVKDTILHEIAHAIAGGAAGHGPQWKKVCRKIGADPVRCFSSQSTTMPKAPYEIYCPAKNCRIKHSRYRRTNTMYMCTIHKQTLLWRVL